MLTRGQKRRLSIDDDSSVKEERKTKQTKKWHTKAVKRKPAKELSEGEGKGEKKQRVEADSFPLLDELLARTQGKGRTLKYLFDQVMGLETDFSRKFCMDVFMFFTPMERMTKLMKFSKRWHDHFAKEKLPWRWVSQAADIWTRSEHTLDCVPFPMPAWSFPYYELCLMQDNQWTKLSNCISLKFECRGRVVDMTVHRPCLKFVCDCRGASRYASCAKLNS
jgi:hypothetical protein